MRRSVEPFLLLAIALLWACSGGGEAASPEGSPSAPAESKADHLSFDDYFAKRVDVFGVPVHATAAAPDAKVLHAAGVLAQYLDNDADAEPDDPTLAQMLRDQDGRIFMAADRDELDAIFERIEAEYPGSLAKTAWWVNPDGITVPDSVWQDLAADETVLVADQVDGNFDGALEEVLHLVSHVGLANAYPDAFAEAPGSRLGDAMDVVRGGRFAEVPSEYPAGAEYTYYDTTCVYQCQAAEYLYWALTSLLGGQSDPARLAEIGEEWRLNTPDKLKTGDPAVYELLTDPTYRLAKVLPDGVYTGGPLEVSIQEWAAND